MLDKEQKEVLEYILNKGSCIAIGPPGTGKTEVLNEVAGGLLPDQTAAFLPFTRAARKELADRLPYRELQLDGEVFKVPNHKVVVATINSLCQRNLKKFPGSFEDQIYEFLDLEEKPKFDLVGIDEVQDLSPLHFRVIEAVKTNHLFAAGDPCQTIYTFSTALGEEIFEMLDDLGCKRFQLHNDYRSGPEVVSILNALNPGADIIAKGPKTFGRNAVFTRTHDELEGVSNLLERQGIPHILRKKNGRDRKVLGGSNIFLMVVHSSKGLGFDKVFLCDWRDLTFFSGNPQEEYNLLYVSVSRAAKEFYLVEGNPHLSCWPHLRGTQAHQIIVAELMEELIKGLEGDKPWVKSLEEYPVGLVEGPFKT